MTAAEFRRAALSLPEATEGAHMAHPDFRVGGKIFAALGHPGPEHASLVLTPLDQDLLLRSHPKAFSPAAGSWGRAGGTSVLLRAAPKKVVALALESAWRRRAPKKLLSARQSVARNADGAVRVSTGKVPAARFAVVRALAAALPGVEESTSYATPALKVKGKLMARMKEDGETLVLRTSMEDRDLLIQKWPEVFFLTAHYRDHPWVLVHLDRISKSHLTEVLEDAWGRVASPALRSRVRRNPAAGGAVAR
ncbi:MAG: MmcQ/YjbR family DNA-binding protein [Gemmatimonadaceae bacterium]